MTITDLADAAVAAGPGTAGVVLTLDEAAAIAETYTDACERCHVLTQALAAARRESARQATDLRERDQLIARLRNEAEGVRVGLAAALAPAVAA